MASSSTQSKETTEKVIKVQILHFRNPAMTEEEYYEHWSNHHAKMAASWLARNGVLKYAVVSLKLLLQSPEAEFIIRNKYHTPQSYRDQISPMAEKAGWKIHDHDGSAEMWVRSLDDLVAATQIRITLPTFTLTRQYSWTRAGQRSLSDGRKSECVMEKLSDEYKDLDCYTLQLQRKLKQYS